MKKFIKIRQLLLSLFLILAVSVGFLNGCASGNTKTTGNYEKSTQERQTEEQGTEEQSTEKESIEESSEEQVTEEESTEEQTAEEQSEEEQLAEDGQYCSREEVALYLHIYGKLPSNYITKNEAKALGWSGGSLEEYAPGKCIGGDTFGNYEGLLPEGKEYKECDIDTLGKSTRGAKRIVFSDDGMIYYTDDHYQSFTLLYEKPGSV